MTIEIKHYATMWYVNNETIPPTEKTPFIFKITKSFNEKSDCSKVSIVIEETRFNFNKEETIKLDYNLYKMLIEDKSTVEISEKIFEELKEESIKNAKLEKLFNSTINSLIENKNKKD